MIESNSEFTHPDVAKGIDKGWDLKIFNKSFMKDGVLFLETGNEKQYMLRARDGAWAIVIVTLFRDTPDIDIDCWAGYANTSESTAHYERQDITLSMGHQTVFQMDGDTDGDDMLHGQPVSMRHATYDFSTGVVERDFISGPTAITKFCPKSPNQTGAHSYMGSDFAIGARSEKGWREALMPLGKYPGVFMTEDVSFVNHKNYPNLTGAAHLRSAVRYPNHWINYSKPGSPWLDRAADGVSCANAEHNSLSDPLCQFYLLHKRPWAALLIVGFAHRWLRQFPYTPKGNWDHRSHGARANGRILKSGCWLYRCLLVIDESLATDVLLAIGGNFLQQWKEFEEDIKATRKPYRSYGGDGYSPPFCGLWWLGLEECRRILEIAGAELWQLDYMQEVLAKFCFDSFHEMADGGYSIAYKILRDGSVDTSKGKFGHSSMGFYCWMAAMAYEPQSDNDERKHDIIAGQFKDKPQWRKLTAV